MEDFMKLKKTNHGGKRKGAGRKKSAPTVVYQLNIDKVLVEAVKELYTVKELNAKIRELFEGLRCV